MKKGNKSCHALYIDCFFIGYIQLYRNELHLNEIDEICRKLRVMVSYLMKVKGKQ